MLHKKGVLLAIYHAMRGRVRRGLRLAPRKRPPPVLGQNIEHVVERHSWILRSVEKHSPPNLDLRGKNVCEVGAGDCLASASHFLSRGASHVDIIEVEPPVVNEKQLEVLRRLESEGHSVDHSMLAGPDGKPRLDASRVTYHRLYMENFQSRDRHEFIFSFSVMEHVEDLDGFYAACWRTLRKGGSMLHMIDLGGHAYFEDPMPPLDFQTYPDWLFRIMYQKYGRATRRFLKDHKQAVERAGFKIEKVTPTRVADQGYMETIWPQLHARARSHPREDVAVIEFALVARKE